MKIIIIGAGPGGYETALCAASKGVEVILVEASRAGGTCLNEGCIPTKSLCRSAQVLDTVREAEQYGIEGGCSFDFGKVVARKNAVVEQLRSGVETLLGHKNITYVIGKASFKDAHCVRVETPEGEFLEFSGDRVIVATGSVAAFLPIGGIDLPGVLTSTEMLDLQEVPQRLCVIGGGVIGLEMASVFRSFGSQVTVLEFCREILPRFDSDISKRLKQALGKRGLDIVTQAQVTGISANCGDGSLCVSYLRKGAQETVIADKVLMAVGRRPATGSLNFSDVGVEYTPKGVIVNGFMQTTNPDIYAVGDITGGLMLAHTATFQGRRALCHILGETDGIDLSVVPAAVFTTPQAAMVGKTEEDCKAEGIDFTVLKSFYRANGKAVSMGCTDGFCKVIAEKSTGRIIGCHILGEEAPDLVHEAMVLINAEVTLDRFSDFIHAHPTLSEILQSVR